MGEKTRADVFLVRRGLCQSREQAQAAIMEGRVFLGDRRVAKPSEMIREEEELTLRAPAVSYVSRGALKLEKAIASFGAKFSDQVVMDIGCSTGGFTDVCLQNGARRVYAIDVGYGQLDWKLRNDPRVTVMERTNARYLEESMFPERPGVTVMDVSFISIRLILPVAARIMGEEGVFYTLIKPQFEAGRDKVGKNGVVRDPRTHEAVILGIMDFVRDQMGWEVCALDYSPITGPKGNIEFLAEIRRRAGDRPLPEEETVRALVEQAHATLNHPDQGGE